MSQEQKDAIDRLMRNAPLDIGGDAVEQRAVFEHMLTAHPLADDVLLTAGELGGVPTVEVEIAGSETDGVLLWFHGGFYVLGSARASAGLAAEIARRTNMRVISVDYRLAPEHPHPAALEDAIAAYAGLLESGCKPNSVAFGGDSAGAGLAVATLVALGATKMPQPSCAVLLSPFVDLALSGASMTGKAAVDPAFTRDAIAVRVGDYVGRVDPAQPDISPLFADLRDSRRCSFRWEPMSSCSTTRPDW